MDLTTSYLGFDLPHPFVSGAGPLADTTDSAKRVEDAGAAAIVMRSLFEEQLHQEELATHYSTVGHTESFGEALSFFPEPEDFVIGPDEYLDQVRRLKEAVDIPVFASLNGYTAGGWLATAKLLEQAGADALELNLYYVPTDGTEPGSAIEERSIAMVREVKSTCRIPVSVKLSPFYTSLAHFAVALEDAGADGLVVFNRFFEPDIDVEQLEIKLELELSQRRELLLRLRWLGILSGNLKSASLAVTGGVHTAIDAIKATMAGASAVQMVSVLLSQGPEVLAKIKQQMADWLEEHEYESLDSMRGSMNILRCPKPQDLARANYMRLLQTWEMGR